MRISSSEVEKVKESKDKLNILISIISQKLEIEDSNSETRRVIFEDVFNNLGAPERGSASSSSSSRGSASSSRGSASSSSSSRGSASSSRGSASSSRGSASSSRGSASSSSSSRGSASSSRG